MSLTTLSLFLLGCAVLAVAFLGATGRLGRRKGDQTIPPVLAPAKAKRGPLADGFCPACHAPGVYLTKAGGPNRRYHRCPPSYTQDELAAIIAPEVQP